MPTGRHQPRNLCHEVIYRHRLHACPPRPFNIRTKRISREQNTFNGGVGGMNNHIINLRIWFLAARET
jgi:hypothetical protein